MRKLEALYSDCPDWADLKLGIGNYRFWRSVRMQKLDWLPFVTDERGEGLRLVEEARAAGRFSPWVAAANLSWMYLEVRRPADALEICEQGLAVWPGSRLFRYPRAEALQQLGHPAEAEAEWASLQAEAEAQLPANLHNQFVCLEKRSGALEDLGRRDEARVLARQALALPLTPEQSARLKERHERLLQRLRRLGD
jgi:tetratricopeptide (TPR) repeat protein